MNNEEHAHILSLDCESRYDYFLDVVSDERDIWILVNNDQCFLKLFAEEEGFEYLPVWPTQSFAEAYANDDPELSAICIPLPEFLKKWVAGLSKDGIEVGVIPGTDKSVWISEAEELARDLQDELSHF